MTRRLHLDVNILHARFSSATRRRSEVDPRATFDVGHCARIAGRLDNRPAPALEPTIVIALSIPCDEPFDIDRASRGRRGTYLGPNADPGSAPTFGLTTRPDHAGRPDPAGAFVEVLGEGGDDAVATCKAAGRFVDLAPKRPRCRCEAALAAE